MNKNFEQMLRLVDYVDGLMVVDKNCIIRHYYTAYPELVNLRQDEPLNRSLFEIYPSLKREDSYICRALETGESFINYEQTYINYKGDSMEANCSAVPIKEHGEVVGVIDMVIYKDAHVTERRLSFDISLISALTKSYNTSDQSLEDIVTQDGEMIRIKEKILQTADSDAHVLVYGKDRHRQGAHRQRHPENQPPQGCPLHQAELRLHPQHPAGEHPLRHHQGQLHRG